jgi:mRNA-degrading endonuclease toxin of MazEF toxin-antitoxin module
MGRYYFGQILLAYVKDGHGHTKDHPVLIVGSDEDCNSGGPLQVVVISTKIQVPCPDYHILVHDSQKTDPHTGLYEPCVVKCNWFQDVEYRRVIRAVGSMPDDKLKIIIDNINLLLEDKSFTNWVDSE